jgi:hypothetical protein
MKVTKLYAFGTRGKAAEKEFVAVKDANGKYVLNKKVLFTSGTQTNYAANKVYVNTLDEAWKLMQDDAYLINLTSQANGRALRKKSVIQVEYAE